jgi:hypothetical protein
MQARMIRLVPPCRPQDVSTLYYHDVDFQMQLRNCPPWVDRPLRYTGDLARNFSGAAFLAMAAASCRLRKSVAAHLFWPCIECRGSARVRCTQSTHAPTDHFCFDGVACFQFSQAPPVHQHRKGMT